MSPLLPPPSRSPRPSSHPADGAHWQADFRISGASMEDTPRQEDLMEASKLVSPCGSPSDTSNIARWAAPIVLDQFAWIGGHMNRDTTATVESDDGHILEVSLWMHKAPALSYLCVHCHWAPNSEPDRANFDDEPHVVAAEGRFVLLRASFVSNSGEDEYFMYKAGNDKSSKLASLDRLPHPSFHLPTLEEFAIVPLGHGDHYLVAALCLGFDMLYYELCIYSSEDETWTSKLLQNPCPQLDKVITSKVVTLGEGIVGWVDLQRGILLCNLHETNPTARYIPLPDPSPENKDKLEALHPGPSARVFRDLTCINGVIKFFDMEHLEVTKPSYLLNSGKLYDSDLLMSRERKETKVLRSYSGWKALMWSRTLSSNCWEMGPVLDAADIMLDSSINSSLLSGLMGEADIGKNKIAFKDLYSAYPTLSTDGDGDDILYLETLRKPNDLDGRMVILDLGTKRVKALGDYSLANHSPSVKAFSPCTVPHVTKGKIPATARVHTKQAHSSKCDPNTASICVGHPSSCRSDDKRPRFLAEKVNHGQYGAQNIVQNDNKQAHSFEHDPNNTSICGGQGHPSSCGSDNKRPRLSAEKVNHGQYGAQNIVQNDHMSLVSQVQNNLAPQQRLINDHTPFYPHHNNQQYFNWWGGSRNPGYALSGPPPLSFSYSQPLEQRATHSSVFGLPKVSQPCFNYCEGASYHAYSQQLPAPASFPEGKHADFSNHQIQLQHLANAHGLPVSESWMGSPATGLWLVPSGV